MDGWIQESETLQREALEDRRMDWMEKQYSMDGRLGERVRAWQVMEEKMNG